MSVEFFSDFHFDAVKKFLPGRYPELKPKNHGTLPLVERDAGQLAFVVHRLRVLRTAPQFGQHS